MGREDLVVSYSQGSLSWRMFIRLLVGTGVTVGAATAYAAAFSPAASATHSTRRNYDLYDLYVGRPIVPPSTGPGPGVGRPIVPGGGTPAETGVTTNLKLRPA